VNELAFYAKAMLVKTAPKKKGKKMGSKESPLEMNRWRLEG
jgi:hypothetical protein